MEDSWDVCPAQILFGLAVAVTLTPGFTLTFTVFEALQPPVVPVTVYMVVVPGATVTGFPFKPPGVHEYVVAPVAES